MSKKLAKNVLNNPTGALDNTANLATAAVSKNPKNVLKTLSEVINIYPRGKGLYLGEIFFIPCKWNKEQIDYTHQHR